MFPLVHECRDPGSDARSAAAWIGPRSASLLDDARRHGAVLSARLRPAQGRRWQSTLKTTTRAGAEERLRALGYTWQRLENGSLRATMPVLCGVCELPDGRRAFFNPWIAAYCGWKNARNEPPQAIMLGSGTRLDGDGARRATRIAEGLAFDLPCRQGNVAPVDNFVTVHGRRPFSGTGKVLPATVEMKVGRQVDTEVCRPPAAHFGAFAPEADRGQVPIELLPGGPQAAAQLAPVATVEPALALARLELGELGPHFVDQVSCNSQVDRAAAALGIAHHEQIVGAGAPAGARAPGRRDKSMASQQRAMRGDEPRSGLAALVVRNAIFQNFSPRGGSLRKLGAVTEPIWPEQEPDGRLADGNRPQRGLDCLVALRSARAREILP